MSPMSQFSPVARSWFAEQFHGPTEAQAGAWTAIPRGEHTLVVAPTGSGKTLAAFLWALDRLTSDPEPRGCRVVYVSPLKALAADVERNLRAPLQGLTCVAAREGLPLRTPSVAMRTGDTPQRERRRFAAGRDDILITTPESLFLLLTSRAREALRGVEVVIIDEIHAIAGSKRGAHLAVSLERLDALAGTAAQRIGLSATVSPIDEVSAHLAGGRPVTVVSPPSAKQWDLSVSVPAADMRDLPPDDSGQPGMWPRIEARIADEISCHRSTLVFVNSRKLSERLTSRLNDLHARRLGHEVERVSRPSEVAAAAVAADGTPIPVLARAHHGSMSRHERTEVEELLKSGALPAVVATSSLELGIDMGAVDMVIQVSAPPSVASGLQRVGRAGHQVGATSSALFLPTHPDDIVVSTAVVDRMRAGRIEDLRPPRNPLDVLAQQIVAIVSGGDISVVDLTAMIRKARPFTALPDSLLEATLDMLSGRYPDDDFADLRPRLNWDREAGLLSARPGAQRLAVTSGGTIPDRGQFGVFLAGDGPGRRVGELDEEMVHESRVGDVIALGTSSWRIMEITPQQVLVTPAPGLPARLPFWRGDAIGRPAALGEAVGALRRTLAAASPERARALLSEAGLDEWGCDNALAWLEEQREAVADLPTDRTCVLEYFRDEIGDWRVVLHSPWGRRVHAPWALAIAAALQESRAASVDAMATDDGIVMRLPDSADPEQWRDDLREAILVPSHTVEAAVTAQLGESAVFAARFRECADRALLLPHRRPGQRRALWQQRQRASQLLSVARVHPTFPLTLEAARECLVDVFDLPSLTELLEKLETGAVALLEVTTPRPSPFARSLANAWQADHLYDDDTPLAERRAAALSMDPDLLSDLLGGRHPGLRELLDADILREVERSLQHLTEPRRARRIDDIADLLRVLGPLSTEEVVARSAPQMPVEQWLTELTEQRRIFRFGRGTPRWAIVEDAARLRDAVGLAIPAGVPTPEPTGDAMAGLVARFARTHAPFTARQCADALGTGIAVVQPHLEARCTSGRLVAGEFWPVEAATGDPEYCDAEVLRMIRRRSLAAWRHQVEAVPVEQLGRFSLAWHGISTPRRGHDALLDAVDRLAGARLPASQVETHILPARVRDFTPAMLDEAMSSGEVVWQGHGRAGAKDAWISLHRADEVDLTRAVGAPVSEDASALLQRFPAGQWLTLPVALEGLEGAAADEALWELVWAGHLASATLGPIRTLLGASPPRAAGMRRRSRFARVTRTPVPLDRWAALPEPADDTERAAALARLLIDRHGVVTRGAVAEEGVSGGFSAVYSVLAALEEAGGVRRGYFVEGLGAAQFAEAGTVDRLRAAEARTVPLSPLGAADGPGPVCLAAADPAQVFGSALPWPELALRPSRRAGACVVTDDGALMLWLQRGGRSLAWATEDDEQRRHAAAALIAASSRPGGGDLLITHVDGVPALGAAPAAVRPLEAAGFALTPRGWRWRRA